MDDRHVVSFRARQLFAVYLSIDLISFAMISYIYRVTKIGDSLDRIPLLAGACVLLLLVAAGFAV